MEICYYYHLLLFININIILRRGKKKPEAEGMNPLVKCLPGKQGDWSLDPQNPCKKQGVGAHTVIPLVT